MERTSINLQLKRNSFFFVLNALFLSDDAISINLAYFTIVHVVIKFLEKFVILKGTFPQSMVLQEDLNYYLKVMKM